MNVEVQAQSDQIWVEKTLHVIVDTDKTPGGVISLSAACLSCNPGGYRLPHPSPELHIASPIYDREKTLNISDWP